MNLMISTLVIAGLLFSGGTAVYAARDDLPSEPLYPVKLWSEETTLQFQNDPLEETAYLMTMAQTRIQEMARLMADGEPIPEETPLLLQQHIEQALRLCADLDDATCDQAMLQIRDRLQEQDRQMLRLLIDAPEDTQPILLRARDMLRTHLQQVEDGLVSSDMNPNMIQNQNQNGQSDASTPPAQTETGTQFNQPTKVPGKSNSAPGEPNSGSGNSDDTPGDPNTDAGPDDPGGGNPNGGDGNKP